MLISNSDSNLKVRATAWNGRMHVIYRIITNDAKGCIRLFYVSGECIFVSAISVVSCGNMPKTVVIIDDDADDLDLMNQAFTMIDSTIQLVSFIYPDEAIRLLAKQLILVPDFIFIDINMQRLRGDECLEELRTVAHFKQTPIIMFSTSMPSDVAETLSDRGATYMFEKPTKLEQYIVILETIIYGAAKPGLIKAAV